MLPTPDDRDPRTDPRPGDVLQETEFVCEVQAVTDTMVRYVEYEVRCLNIEKWRRLRRGCRVVSRGAEGGGS